MRSFPDKKEVQLERDFISGELVPKIDERALERFKSSDSLQVMGISDLKPELNLTSAPISDAKQSENNSKDIDYVNRLTRSEKARPVGLRDQFDATWRLIDHTHGDLAFFITLEGVVLFHCRAALERIRFEELEDSFKMTCEKRSQSLLLLSQWN